MEATVRSTITPAAVTDVMQCVWDAKIVGQVYTYIYICGCVGVRVCVRVYMDAYMYTYIHMYLYIFAYIQQQSPT